ncbi:MAG: Vms1/Ankzf1 family peptidyl-tRNA hydrolase [Kineosporiaceae bacterium]
MTSRDQHRSWHHLLQHPGPFATVSLDAGRADESGAREVDLRWAEHERTLGRLGAPGAVLDLLRAAAASRSSASGEVGRLVVVGGAGPGEPEVLLDLVLPVRPVREEALWGPAPHLMPALRAAAGVTPYLLVRLDRAGADLELHGDLGEEVRTEQVDGDHDVLHKVPGGGWSHLRMQHRVEDSWDHNAGEVAARVDRLAVAHRPAAVLVAGDDKATARFVARLGAATAPLVTRLSSGGRADGVDEAAMAREVAEVLDGVRRRRRADVIDRFAREEGRGEAAVTGVAAVADALRKGQVDEIVLLDDPSSTSTLWVGDAPTDVATSREDLVATGSARAEQTRADAALVWAAVASDAGVRLVEDGEVALHEGIGAVLRWADLSTPRDAVPSMPGHGR